MADNIWQQRIRRAEKLAAQHSFATEILTFYVHLARFQQDLYRRIEASTSPGVSSAGEWASWPLPGGQNNIATFFQQFLTLAERHGPERLAEVARALSAAPSTAWSASLNTVWAAHREPPSNPEEFLAFAFLQPYAEFARSESRLQLDVYSLSLCPFCSRKPALGVLRQQGDGGRRSLICGFCLAEWEFRRVVCPGCGQEDHAKLPVYTAETFPHIRVECCDTCQTYIKSIDLTKNGLADPLVDELASVPLNLWAQEHGYAKLYPNLLGM